MSAWTDDKERRVRLVVEVVVYRIEEYRDGSGEWVELDNDVTGEEVVAEAVVARSNDCGESWSVTEEQAREKQRLCDLADRISKVETGE